MAALPLYVLTLPFLAGPWACLLWREGGLLNTLESGLSIRTSIVVKDNQLLRILLLAVEEYRR